MADCNVVVLISGSGSNLQALIDSITQDGNPARIAAVICNRADAYGLVRAQNAGIPTRVLDHKQFDGREAFDAALIEAIDGFDPQLVVLAGFMRILTPGFVQHYSGRLLNIHPSLLPAFPGLHTHERALEAGCRIAGCTIHFVTAELDCGPIIAQGVVPIIEGDNADNIAERVLAVEHQLFPQAVADFINGKLKVDGHRVHGGTSAAADTQLLA